MIFGVFSYCLEWNQLLKPVHLFASLSCVKLVQPEIVFRIYGDTSGRNLNPHNQGSRRVGLMCSVRDPMGNDQRLVPFKIMILYIPKASFLILHNSFALMFTFYR
jgi:hypothetical protein